MVQAAQNIPIIAFSIQSNQAFDLAQSRYRLGVSFIVGLTQAQLNQTEAQIGEASSKYDYEAELSALNYQMGALR